MCALAVAAEEFACVAVQVKEGHFAAVKEEDKVVFAVCLPSSKLRAPSAVVVAVEEALAKPSSSSQAAVVEMDGVAEEEEAPVVEDLAKSLYHLEVDSLLNAALEEGPWGALEVGWVSRNVLEESYVLESGGGEVEAKEDHVVLR